MPRSIDLFADIRGIHKGLDKAFKDEIQTVFISEPDSVGYFIKLHVGSPPTLFNAGKNTRIRYRVLGLTSDEMHEINGIDKTVSEKYMVDRMGKLFELADSVEFDMIRDETFNDNLIMVDSSMPKIFGELVRIHYARISEGIYDCGKLTELLEEENPLGYKKKYVYRYKLKKMMCAAALGMTPGKEWDGFESATGGYIIIKKDGDVLCYNLYNRNAFEEYLFNNTQVDRPSASRYEYGYVYEEDGQMYVDLNVQIRFKALGNVKGSAVQQSNDRVSKYAPSLLKEMTNQKDEA